jgi:hypothetical protein
MSHFIGIKSGKSVYMPLHVCDIITASLATLSGDMQIWRSAKISLLYPTSRDLAAKAVCKMFKVEEVDWDDIELAKQVSVLENGITHKFPLDLPYLGDMYKNASYDQEFISTVEERMEKVLKLMLSDEKGIQIVP